MAGYFMVGKKMIHFLGHKFEMNEVKTSYYYIGTNNLIFS